MLNHAINYIESNPLVTPTHIVPEWYFLPYYAILRCISTKEIGIIYMAFSIMILFVLPKIELYKEKVATQKTRYKQYFRIFFINVTFLGFMGMETINTVSIYSALLSTGTHWIYLITPYIRVETYMCLLNTKITSVFEQTRGWTKKIAQSARLIET
jgi:ubiquinol-cytochrome c reductase cytochrome b subunit